MVLPPLTAVEGGRDGEDEALRLDLQYETKLLEILPSLKSLHLRKSSRKITL